MQIDREGRDVMVVDFGNDDIRKYRMNDVWSTWFDEKIRAGADDIIKKTIGKKLKEENHPFERIYEELVMTRSTVDEAVSLLKEDEHEIDSKHHFISGGFKGSIDEFMKLAQNNIVSSYADGGWVDYLVPADQVTPDMLTDGGMEFEVTPSITLIDDERETNHDENGSHYLIMPTNGEYIRFNLTDDVVADYAFGLSHGFTDGQPDY